MPRVSIIIPVYNVESYLRQCLDSVVNQTMRDIEAVCVDDGSTDGSAAILREYAAKDTRIKVISIPNSGTVVARQEAVAAATGEFFDEFAHATPGAFAEAFRALPVIRDKHLSLKNITGVLDGILIDFRKVAVAGFPDGGDPDVHG